MPDRPRFVSELRDQLIGASHRLKERRRRVRRIVGGVAVLCVIGLAVVAVSEIVKRDATEIVVVGADNYQSSTTEADSGRGAPLDLPADPRSGDVWSEATTVIGGETLPSVFWIESEVLVLRTENGGADVIGERWDPITNVATPIAPSGLTWRTSAATVWTGLEVLVVGGSSGPELNHIGAAYNPADDSWRVLADPPGTVDGWEEALLGPGVWTGTEMIVWPSGLAYNPLSDSWRTIADSPLSSRSRPVTAWTGTELFVWGGCDLEVSQCDESNSVPLADGALYNPGNDEWSALPETFLRGSVATVAGWFGTEVFIFATDPGSRSGADAAAFDPVTMTWREVAPFPLSRRQFAAGVWANDQFVVWGGASGERDLDDGAVYDPVTDRWALLPAGLGLGRSFHSMVSSGDHVYVSASATAATPLWLQPPPSIPPESNPPSVPDVNDELRPLVGERLELPAWLAPRGGHSVSWTGTEMLVWGGWSDETATESYADGAAYNPATRTWREIATSPLTGRGYHTAAWTGDRLLIVGGQSDPGTVVDDGASYDPTTDTWETITPSGVLHEPATPVAVETAWTGQGLVLWYRDQGAVRSYDPTIDLWTDLPDLNLPRSESLGAIHWTGTELVALAGEGPGAMSAATLRPGADEAWSELPPVSFETDCCASDPFPSNSAVVDGQLVVWSRSGGDASTFILDLTDRTWTEIATIPVSSCEGHFLPLALESQILVIDTCLNDTTGGAAVYDSATQTWEVLQVGPDGQANLGEAVWTGREVLVVATCCFGAPDLGFEWAGVRYLLG